MGKQPAAGQKKSKESIAKAATQKKGGAKVFLVLLRNGPRAKLKKRLIMQSSLIGQPTTGSSTASPNLANTSPLPHSFKSSKLSAPSPGYYSTNASRMDQSKQSSSTASKPSTLLLQWQYLRRQLQCRQRMLWLRSRRFRRRNDQFGL